MRNPYEDDFAFERGNEEPEDESSPCSCGDPGCRLDGNDASNVLVGGRWFAAECAQAQPEVAAYLDADLKADEAEDDFNRTRR